MTKIQNLIVVLSFSASLLLLQVSVQFSAITGMELTAGLSMAAGLGN